MRESMGTSSLINPMPFIALSATVGNPEQFHSWLSKVQSRKNHEVRLIPKTLPSRYSDLQKYVYYTGYSPLDLTSLNPDQQKVRIIRYPSLIYLSSYMVIHDMYVLTRLHPTFL